MRRKGQVFSMPVKVSIGQDRNKKDPHRGRKLSGISILQAQRIVVNRNKKAPQRGRKLKQLVTLLLVFIEIKKIPIGDGNPLFV